MLDRGQCPYCDGPMTWKSRDHIVPKALGGNRGPRNIIDVCRACSQLKGQMTPDAMRALASDIEREAASVRKIADRVAFLIADRNLLSAIDEGRAG